MRDLANRLVGHGARRWAAPAAALVAASLLVASVAPSAAFGPTTWRPIASHDASMADSRYHAYRGAQQDTATGLWPANGDWPANGEMTVATEEVDGAVAYCADRFKSYDPSSGTYIGYDGHEHACP